MIPAWADIGRLLQIAHGDFESQAPGITAEVETGRIHVESLLKAHGLLADSLTNRLWNDRSSSLALAVPQMTTYAVHLIRPIDVLHRAGLPDAVNSVMRTVEENASNLFFILYAGPASGEGTREDLATQFLLYRHIEQAKYVNKSRAEYGQRFRDGWVPPPSWQGPRDLQAFEKHCDEVIGRSKDVKAVYPKMAKSSWHTLTKEDRSARVLQHLPDFAKPYEEHWRSNVKVNQLYSAKIHASPMNFKLDKSELSSDQLFALPSLGNDPGTSIVAVEFAKLCWLSLGDTFAVFDEVKECLEGQMKEVSEQAFKRLKRPAMLRL